MQYLGSPVTTVPKLDKNLELGEDQAEEISDELMEFSLEDQKETKVKCSLMASLYFSFSFLNKQYCITSICCSHYGSGRSAKMKTTWCLHSKGYLTDRVSGHHKTLITAGWVIRLQLAV